MILNCPQDLLEAAEAVLPNCYAPYSQFSVAASIRAASGKVYSGINVENAAYPLTCCAEQSAISSMATHGERKLTEALILVPGPDLCPPCGACRQILNEFAPAECLIHLCTQQGSYKRITLGELLPLTFGSDNLKKANPQPANII